MTREHLKKSVENMVENVNNTEINDLDLENDLYDPLDVRVEASLDGSVYSIRLVMATGGPHIELELGSGIVAGYWGGMSPVRMRTDNKDLTEYLFDYYSEMFEVSQ